MNQRSRFKQSAMELKEVKGLVCVALLLALRLALGYVTTIQISDNIKIGYTIFPTTLLCMMFGPVAGGIAGGAADLIGFMLKPTGAFFPGYTLDSIVAGIIYGVSFYKREKITFLRVLLTLTTVTVLVNLCMTTTWISVQYAMKSVPDILSDPGLAFADFSKKFLAILPARALKNALMLPINTVGVYVVLKEMKKILPKVGFYDVQRCA